MDSLSDEDAESLYDLFNNSCQNFPDNTAILHDSGEHLDVIIKYTELMSELEKLSLCLSQFCGNCTYIGMCIRNLHLAPTVILGILRVGKAYVAVGRDWRLLRRLGCRWLVAERGGAMRGCRLRARLRLHGRPLGLWEVRRAAPRAPGPVGLAFAVRTSGSTGRATTVQVPHAAILPNITDLRRELRMEPSDVVLLAAPLTFDPSAVEMFLALSSGAALKVAAPAVRGQPRRLLRGVTVLQATPSVLGHWLGEHGTLPSHLRALLLGGEPCPPLPVLARWVRGCARCHVFNVYGLTEVSCWASVQRVRWDAHAAGVPLGAPLSHTLLCVRDTTGRPVTHGEGSLFVGSLERTCFVGDEEPRVLTEPVLRATGDIVQVDGASGSVLYAGRADRRVKRWGERVDLDAVEREVRRWRADARCRAVWDDRSHRLGLFLLGDARRQARDVRWHLARHLPPAARPDTVRVLPRWPLSSHGKVDDAALKRSLREGERREGDLERTFASLWLEYLGPQEPAANDSFTRCGGNSFVALQLAAELERLCGQPAPGQLLPLLLGGATFQECRAHVRKLGGTAAAEADSGETGLPRPAAGTTASQTAAPEADSGETGLPRPAGASTASQAAAPEADSGETGLPRPAAGSTASQAAAPEADSGETGLPRPAGASTASQAAAPEADSGETGLPRPAGASTASHAAAPEADSGETGLPRPAGASTASHAAAPEADSGETGLPRPAAGSTASQAAAPEADSGETGLPRPAGASTASQAAAPEADSGETGLPRPAAGSTASQAAAPEADSGETGLPRPAGASTASQAAAPEADSGETGLPRPAGASTASQAAAPEADSGETGLPRPAGASTASHAAAPEADSGETGLPRPAGASTASHAAAPEADSGETGLPRPAGASTASQAAAPEADSGETGLPRPAAGSTASHAAAPEADSGETGLPRPAGASTASQAAAPEADSGETGLPRPAGASTASHAAAPEADSGETGLPRPAAGSTASHAAAPEADSGETGLPRPAGASTASQAAAPEADSGETGLPRPAGASTASQAAAPEADSGETGLPRPAGASTASQAAAPEADSGETGLSRPAGGSTASQADSGGLAGGERLCVSSCRGRTTVHCGDCDPEQPAPRDGRARLEVRWKTSLGRCVDASPLVARYCSGRELVVVGCHSRRLAALDAHTGTIVWQVDLPDRIESSVCISPSGTLGVVGCYDGGVYCLRLDTGTLVWRFFTSQMVKSSPSLCQDNSSVAVGSYDHHLYCLRLEDGAVCWRVSLGASVLASPLLEPCSGLVLAAALDGTCVAVSQRGGGLRWKRRLVDPVFSSPALLSSGRALFAEVSGRLLCVEAATGDQVWSLTLGGNVFSSPCVLDTAVLLGCQDGRVYRVDDTGSVCWQTRLDSPVVATPCRLPGEPRAVVVASSGSAYLLELQSGAVQCCQRLPHEVFSSPAACDPRRVCVGCRDDHVYCLDVR
ncbi:beta-alanine-activating enzyme-like isoform X2 [Bacillus rossius redtenbacheri]|uniref:beta-alanine-activating enzyme-like isoform X2 n=1 Tax=Bacillus rossius redtenbacheri TaxID=93214 RepID=UPI002FDE4308